MKTFPVVREQPRYELKPQDPRFLEGMNTQQAKAVAHVFGPLLIVAGAGSGKTRVLTHRIANMLARGAAEPHQILALTFTNKAAREMRERIERLIGPDAKRLWMGTFHSVFSKILRFEAERLGFQTDFSIYDTEDTQKLVKTILDELSLNSQEIKPSAIRHRISSAKNALVSPEEFRLKFVKSSTDDIVSRVYPRYEESLQKNNAFDFDDLLIKPVQLFERHPDALEQYQDRFRFILIDEYQDTNHAQYKVTKLLAGKYKNICVVGDDAQSIYSFRGADIGNILDFKKDYPDATQVPLEQNYRSTKAILRAADSIIKNNRNQIKKELWTDNDPGSPILLVEAPSDREEARKVAAYLQQAKAKFGYTNKDFAILYRTNAQSRLFEDAMRASGIAYQLVGGVSFYQRKEVKDVLAYMKLLVNPQDGEAFMRVINEPGRGIGAKSLEIMRAAANANNLSLWDVAMRIDQVEMHKPAKNAIREFVYIIEQTKTHLDQEPALETVRFLLAKTGYMRQYDSDDEPENRDRKDNVLALLDALAEHRKDNEEATLSTFLQEVTLLTDADEKDEDANTVTLMTIHAAKGLEFPVVFVVGMEENLFPMGGRNGEDADIEEERRLFYVAVTRAEKYLYLSHARVRFKYGEEQRSIRSRFIDELDPQILRTESGTAVTKSSRFAENTPKIPSLFQNHDWRKPAVSASAPKPVAPRVTVEPQSLADFRPGAVVFHEQFGHGKIMKVEGSGSDARLVVFFQATGNKTLLLRFAKLKLVRE
jgi:DNA helicase-2/ATP-dependent DNA helicase PcrA